jgi:YVTN family beta-propeller protein
MLVLIGCSSSGGGNDNGGNGSGDDSTFGSAEGMLIVVANSDDDTVTIIDANTQAVEATVALTGTYPWEIALSENQTVAYVSNRDSNNISIVDIVSGAELGTIALTNTQPSKAIVASDGYLYVTHANAAVVTKVDIAAATPAQDSTIAITATSGGAIAESMDGASLYVGSLNDTELCKIDIATGTETSAVATFSIADIKIDTDGTAFIAPVNGYEIAVYDTLTDTMGTAVEMTVSVASLDMTDLTIQGGRVFVAANSSSDSGGVAEFAVDVDQTNFQYDSRDDHSYSVDLPFTFTFDGTDYTTVYMCSNGVASLDGYYEYDEGVENILGFTPNNEDLDSSNIFNYSSRTYPDRAVFQWLTSTDDDEPNVNYFYMAQVILYDDDTVRFNILGSGPTAYNEDDGYQYGVGDGSGTALVDLRPTYGSPFSIERLSLTWNPASPTTMTEVAFDWEDIGLHFNPAYLTPYAGYVDGVAVAGPYIYMAIPENYNSDTVSEVLVYDRETMLPLASTVAVGAGARAIAAADPQ